MAASSARAPQRGKSAPGPGVRDPAREAWELLAELFVAQRGRMLSIASELELNPPQLLTLQWLEEPLPMGELAGRLHCDSSNVTGIVDRLETRGLVERRADERDRRVKLLVLTEEGQRLRELVVGRMHEPPPAITGLSRPDQQALRDIMRRAVDQP